MTVIYSTVTLSVIDENMKYNFNIVMDIRDTIILSMMQEEAVNYFEKRHKVKKEYMNEIDFEIMEKVLNASKNELGQKVKNINYEWHTMEVSKPWGLTN